MTRPLKRLMQLPTTGSHLNLMKMTASFRRFPMRMIWNFRMEILSGIFPSISDFMRVGMNDHSNFFVQGIFTRTTDTGGTLIRFHRYFCIMIFSGTLPQQISTSLLLLFLPFSEYQYRRCHHSRKYKDSDKYFKWCIVSGLRTGCCFHTV